MKTMTRLAGAVCLMALSVLPSAAAEEKFKSFDDARSAAARFMRERRLAEAQEPLEAALRMAPDDKARLDIYRALSSVYRQLPEIEKKLEADEFVIRHSPRQSGRSVPARDVVSFLHQRGKTDVGIERYEAVLKEKPEDVVALTILSMIYSQSRRNPDRVAELKPRLEEVNRQIATRSAEQLEKDAEFAPRLAASYLKDAAVFWLEAGDKAKAQAAARKSAASLPETRSDILTFYWHDGLGDVFLATGEPKLAVERFEAAIAVTKIDSQRTAVEKKLTEAKAALGKQ